MQHPNFETRHPLQQDEQETGYDPLQNYNKNRDRKCIYMKIKDLIVWRTGLHILYSNYINNIDY